MVDLKFESAFTDQVRLQIRSGTPPREIMTMLMSNGWTEVEAQTFVDRLTKDVPAAEVAGTRRTDLSSGMPIILAGCAMLVMGIVLAGFFNNRGDELFEQRGLFLGGGLLIAGGLARLATGRD